MGDELETAFQVGVGLIITGIILGIILVLVGVSRQYGREFTNGVTTSMTSQTGAEIEALQTDGEKIPVASVYLVAKRNASDVQTVYGTIKGVSIGQAEDLTKYMDAKVYVTITKVAGPAYKIAVQDY